MCLLQKIYCDSNSTKNVGCNNSYSNSTSSPSFWTHQPTWYESVYWSEIRYSLPALCPPILHFCQKCLNARQKLGTRNSKVWMLLKTVKNLKNSKVTHSHSLTLSFYHSLAILLSHSLSLDMLNNFCLFLISLVDFLSLRNVRRNKMMIDDLGWIYCKTLLQNLPEPMIFGTCSWQRDWLLQIYRVHLSEPEGGVTNSQSKYRGCRKPTVFATNTGTSI